MAISIQIFEVTAAYSNAVLVAVMPYVADFAKRLELPIPQPITFSQVRQFKCSWRSDLVGGRVILTNGYEFGFLEGRVDLYRNPRSYYDLQDPNLIPKFYGPVKLTQEQALQAAHRAIKKLGYTDALLSADRPPRVTPPPRVGKNYVPRYCIRWNDPNCGSDPNNPAPSIEFEVDATTGAIQGMVLSNPSTVRPDPPISVHPPVVGHGPQDVYIGGRTMYPVSPAYSNAFLRAILPECAQYVRTAGFSIPLALCTNKTNMANCVCGLVDNDPMAELDMKSGERFVYRHGQVIDCYTADAEYIPGREGPRSRAESYQYWKRFYGPINMTTNEAVALVRQTARKLGYSERVLRIDAPPIVNGPGWRGTNRIARCFVLWLDADKVRTRVSAEVDMARRTLKSLYLNDHLNTNIWRYPPKIDVPTGAVVTDHEKPPPAPAPRTPAPPPTPPRTP